MSADGANAGPDDRFGDRAFLEAKRAAAAAGGIDAVKRGREDAVRETIDVAAKHGLDVSDRLRSEIMDMDRIDVERLVAADAELERKEHGFIWEPDDLGLPPHCPVVPLGKKNATFFYLTPDRELSAMPAGNFGQAHIDALFCPQTAYLVTMWGAASKTNKRRVQYETVRRDLMDACGRKGVFDPNDRVRGRGAWKGDRGELILHYGDQVVIDGEVQEPGIFGAHVYPAGPKLAPPKGDGGEDSRAAARRLLELFNCWNWARGDLDARLLLGWCVVSMYGAAVDWRPQVMLTGDAGMGKSTLQYLIKAVMGDRLLDVADATAAGLYQTLSHDALGVAFDEFENEDEAKGAAVMRLARLAASGGKVARGGADGVPTNYQARGAFLFSAINPPALRPAEQSRTTILALRPPKPGAKAPKVSAEEAAALGSALLARVVSTWKYWPERLTQFREALGAAGLSNRAQDQLGTLLAAADLVLQDLPSSSDEMEELIAPLIGFGVSDAGAPNWRRCLNHILTAAPDSWRDWQHKQIGAALKVFLYPTEEDMAESRKPSLDYLRRRLSLVGLSLVREGNDAADPVYWLAFSKRSSALARVYEGTDWSARRGADGAWVNALQQAPDSLWKAERFRTTGGREHGILVRADIALEAEEGFD
jgi:hypothetical protein